VSSGSALSPPDWVRRTALNVIRLGTIHAPYLHAHSPSDPLTTSVTSATGSDQSTFPVTGSSIRRSPARGIGQLSTQL
jgi:hypothetical protein